MYRLRKRNNMKNKIKYYGKLFGFKTLNYVIFKSKISNIINKQRIIYEGMSFLDFYKRVYGRF